MNVTPDWAPPRCRHHHIILGCPRDDCPEQSAYLTGQQAALDQWEAQQRNAAKRLVDAALARPTVEPEEDRP